MGGMDTLLTLLYQIATHEVNVSSEGIFILANVGTSTSQTDNTFMHIGCSIDDYKYSF